ncbi:MAG: hypothetical protein ACOYL8_02740 [Patescibacteria group bacterium]
MIITRKHVLSFIFLSIFSIIQFLGLSIFAKPALADDALFNNQIGINEIGSAYGKAPGSKPADIRLIVLNIVQIALGFLAAIFLVLTVFAGYRYMTAAGNEDQTKKAIAQITNAAIGLFIILASWVLTSSIIRYLARAVNDSVQMFP